MLVLGKSVSQVGTWSGDDLVRGKEREGNAGTHIRPSSKSPPRWGRVHRYLVSFQGRLGYRGEAFGSNSRRRGSDEQEVGGEIHCKGAGFAWKDENGEQWVKEEIREDA